MAPSLPAVSLPNLSKGQNKKRKYFLFLFYNVNMYFVYLLKCKDGSIYTGITTSLERRFNEHKNGKGGHYTSSRKVIEMVYNERVRDRSEALKREAQIKRWQREEKLNLIRFGKSII